MCVHTGSGTLDERQQCSGGKVSNGASRIDLIVTRRLRANGFKTFHVV